jgi:YVTN family beta-propeller protein
MSRKYSIMKIFFGKSIFLNLINYYRGNINLSKYIVGLKMEKHSYVKNQIRITKTALKFIGIFVLYLIFTSSITAANTLSTNTAASTTNSTVDTSQNTSTGSKVKDPSESICNIFPSRTVYVGEYPHGIAMSQDGKKVYVVNSGDGTVSVINTTTNDVVTNINVEDSLTEVTLSPDGKKLYVARPSKICVIDTETNKVNATLTTDTTSVLSIYSPDGKRYIGRMFKEVPSESVYLATYWDEIILTIYLGYEAKGAMFGPDGKMLYVTNGNTNTVSVIDTKNDTLIATDNVGFGSRGVAVSLDGKILYETNGDFNTVSILNATTKNVRATVNVGKKPYGVAVSPDGNKVYVTNSGSNTISIIDMPPNYDNAVEASNLYHHQIIEQSATSVLFQNNADSGSVLKVMQ